MRWKGLWIFLKTAGLLILVVMFAANQQPIRLSVLVSAQKRDKLPDLPLQGVHLKNSNVALVLQDIADSYNIPIGLEISPKDDLLKERNILIDLENGTLKDVLNLIVKQNPLYTWSIEDNVVNVFPKDDHDAVLRALLETRIVTFRVPLRTSRFTFRETLTEALEVRQLLASYNVKSNNEIFLSRDIAPLGRDFSLNLADASVRTILNGVIRDSETKYWIVNRYGGKRQFLLLNL